jgi:hypothetical protein
MRLTMEKNREAIRRFRHIRPAPFWTSARCAQKCPGTQRTCTREKGHRGPHVAHQRFRRVVAVWDAEAEALPPVKTKARSPGRLTIGDSGSGSKVSRWKTLMGGLIPSSHFIEATVLLVLALSMVAFAIDVALRILGLR